MQLRAVAIGTLLIVGGASVAFTRQAQVIGDTSAPVEQGQAAEEVTPERPNVLIIMTDDQNASSDGYAVMDDTMRLFREGGTHYANAIATTPLCCPSRASIFSGRYAHNTGVKTQDPAAFDATKTMQFNLKNAGYKTALAGGKYLNNSPGTPPYVDLVSRYGGYYTSTGYYSTTRIKNKALSFLNTFETNDSQPWLMYVHTTAPHEPATPENKYATASVPPYTDNPATTEEDRSDKPSYVQRFVIRRDVLAFRENQIRTLYSVDDLVQAVMARLGALGETNTIAFFTSDNGYVWNEHKVEEKRLPYTQSLKVPFFVRWPGHAEVVPGGTNDELVANIDIAPTVYEATGVTPSNYTPDGRSIFDPGSRDHIFMEYVSTNTKVPSWKGLWSPAWTYVEYPASGFKEYYAPDDPWQLDNGFKTNDPPTNAAELQSQLQADQGCAGASCP